MLTYKKKHVKKVTVPVIDHGFYSYTCIIHSYILQLYTRTLPCVAKIHYNQKLSIEGLGCWVNASLRKFSFEEQLLSQHFKHQIQHSAEPNMSAMLFYEEVIISDYSGIALQHEGLCTLPARGQAPYPRALRKLCFYFLSN